jgi:3'-phosphoadenosine 5'-phosphosulfate sulfotransferase (PAPS reductase)/FAD synthetase
MSKLLPLGPIAPLPASHTFLTDYDVIVINTSAGKDSQTILRVVTDFARDLGILDRCVAVHADLGRMEWHGTKALAEVQASAAGVRFLTVSRIGEVASRDGKAYRKGERFGDLLDYVERRGRWPDNRNRYCTSDFKRGPVDKLHTALAQEWKARTGSRRPCRILNVMGMRAQESPARAKLPPNEVRRDTSGALVIDWLPIHEWTEAQVWDHIRASGVPHHPAYDRGMRRLSCVLCIFAPDSALLIAGAANPDLLEEYAAVEERIGHTFRQKTRLTVIRDKVRAGQVPAADDTADDTGCWNM